MKKLTKIIMPIVLIMMIPLIGIVILSAIDDHAVIMPGYERVSDIR